MRVSALIFLLILGGCATETASQFVPYTVEIKKEATFKNDLVLCRSYALNYLKERDYLNGSEIVREGATAGLGNLATSVVSPTATALAALGGASGEALSELGLNGLEAKKIIANCLHDKGLRSGDYLTLDPNL